MNKVLVIGSGGREHALGWKLAQSPKVDELFFAPGNPGTAQLGTNIDISALDTEKLAKFATGNKIDLTVVGPDESLALAVVDVFEKQKLNVFGPTKAAARLEWDKVFADKFMERHQIPHPRAASFSDYKLAFEYIRKQDPRIIVIKASGLAAGKGVILPSNIEDAQDALRDMIVDHKFGTAGEQVLVQNRLVGKEVSVFAICNSTDYVLLPICQDYKRLLDSDKGPNTGGMGVVAPVEVLSKDDLQVVEQKIIQPTLKGMMEEGYPFKGVLYLGLMRTTEGTQVIEYNARFGDPEAQALMPILNLDLFELLNAVAEGKKLPALSLPTQASAVITLASSDYPTGKSQSGTIHGLPAHNILVFQAGTGLNNGQIEATGGRVLSVVGRADNIGTALGKAYKTIGSGGIHFKGMQYRKDIGLNM